MDEEQNTGSAGVRTNDMIPNFAIIGNCRLGNWQGHHNMEILKSIGDTLNMDLESEMTKIFRLGKIREDGSARPYF